ncbi:hypothetical protein [Nocardia sp. Marseille-Q1738]
MAPSGDDLELAVDARIAAVHDRLGLREVSRTRGADGVVKIDLERVQTSEEY